MSHSPAALLPVRARDNEVRAEGTRSIHSIDTVRREAFSWLAVLSVRRRDEPAHRSTLSV
jgi:BMFP domain-containing protein YqiC